MLLQQSATLGVCEKHLHCVNIEDNYIPGYVDSTEKFELFLKDFKSGSSGFVKRSSQSDTNEPLPQESTEGQKNNSTVDIL